MSPYFAAKLTELLEGKSRREVAELSGLGQSTLSLYASGSRGISVEALGELLRAFPDRREQLQLVRAHLLDEIPAEIFGELDIIFRGSIVEEAQAPYDKDLDGTLELLRVKARDNNVRTLLIDLQRILS